MASSVLASLLLAAPLVQAGMQTSFVIFNRSPYDVTIDFSEGNDNCIYWSFNPDDLNDYYSAYAADRDSVPYLGTFQDSWGAADLTTGIANTGGSHTLGGWTDPLGPKPFIVFGTEMQGSGDCFGAKSVIQWDMTVNGQTWTHSIVDPPDSHWSVWQKDPAGDVNSIDLGSGGEFNMGIFDQLDSAQSQPNIQQAIQYNDPSNPNNPPPPPPLTFTSWYDNVDEDSRTACIIGQNAAGSYDCMDTGVALVITREADAIFAVAMPNVGNTW